jgi:hypothetical protein
MLLPYISSDRHNATQSSQVHAEEPLEEPLFTPMSGRRIFRSFQVESLKCTRYAKCSKYLRQLLE